MWTLTAILTTTVICVGLVAVQDERSWSSAQGLNWKDYLKSGTRGQVSARSSGEYTLLEGMTAKGQGLLLRGDQIEAVTGPDG